VNRPVPFNLKEGTVIVGTAQSGEPGTLLLNALPTGTVMTVPLDSVVGVNQPSVIYMGAIQAGFSQAAGNSHLRNGSLIGELTARGESLRLTLLGRYIYGDDQGTLLVRNSRGTIKLDFASAYFEQDTFQDFKLRTALASGRVINFWIGATLRAFSRI
jgi:hypothetical protein